MRDRWQNGQENSRYISELTTMAYNPTPRQRYTLTSQDQLV